MKKRNLFIPIIAVSGAVAMLASCSSGHDPYANLDFDVDISGASITMWTPFGAEMHAVVEQYVEQWSAITGVTVEIEAKSGYDTLKSAVAESATSGSYPNITFAYPDHMASYVGSDILLRLDKYFAEGANTKYSFASDSPEFKISDFYTDYMRENQSVEFDENGDGYTLGVPFNKSTEVLTYNKTFFEFAAEIDPEIHVPATWDELDTMAEKILNLMETRDYYKHYVGIDKNIYDTNAAAVAATGEDALFDFHSVLDPKKVTSENSVYGFRPLGRDSLSNFFITSLRQYGGEYTTVDKATREGKILFNSNETKTALIDLQNRYNNHYFGIAGTWGESKYCSNPFSAMNCVMTIGSSAGADSNAPKGGKFDVACAPILYKDGSHKYVISQGTNLVLLDKGTNAERIASWELLKYLTKYANGGFAKDTGYFPTCEYAFNSAAYQSFFSKTPRSTSDKINLSAAKVNRDEYTNPSSNWTKFVDAAFDGSSTVRTAVESAIGLITIGLNGSQQTPEKVLTDLVNELSDYQ